MLHAHPLKLVGDVSVFLHGNFAAGYLVGMLRHFSDPQNKGLNMSGNFGAFFTRKSVTREIFRANLVLHTCHPKCVSIVFDWGYLFLQGGGSTRRVHGDEYF